MYNTLVGPLQVPLKFGVVAQLVTRWVYHWITVSISLLSIEKRTGQEEIDCNLCALFDGESAVEVRRFCFAIKKVWFVCMRHDFELDDRAFQEYDNPGVLMNCTFKSHIIMHHMHDFM